MPHEYFSLIGLEPDHILELKKKEKIPSIVVNDWVYDFDPESYKKDANPGVGGCAGFVCLLVCIGFPFLILILLVCCRVVCKAPPDGNFEIKWVDQKIICCQYSKLIKVPAVGGMVSHQGRSYQVVEYKPNQVKLQVQVNATPTKRSRRSLRNQRTIDLSQPKFLA